MLYFIRNNSETKTKDVTPMKMKYLLLYLLLYFYLKVIVDRNKGVKTVNKNVNMTDSIQ